MTDLPATLRAAFFRLITEGRAPAYLELNANRRIVAGGGNLERYGLSLDPSAQHHPVWREAMYVLSNFLSTPELPNHLPKLEINPNVFADVYVLQVGQRTWLLLMDATVEAEALRDLQQEINDNRLARGKRGRKPKDSPASDDALTEDKPNIQG